jgi:G:T-mismatch repair DNA endonuclease (very short patch repair protein)
LSRVKTRKEYWTKKIARNIERDREVNEALQREGWDVLRFWDVDIETGLENVIKIIERHIEKKKKAPAKHTKRRSISARTTRTSNASDNCLR